MNIFYQFSQIDCREKKLLDGIIANPVQFFLYFFRIVIDNWKTRHHRQFSIVNVNTKTWGKRGVVFLPISVVRLSNIGQSLMQQEIKEHSEWGPGL